MCALGRPHFCCTACLLCPPHHTLHTHCTHPQVAREGTKKTVFTNFMDLCKVSCVCLCLCVLSTLTPSKFLFQFLYPPRHMSPVPPRHTSHKPPHTTTTTFPLPSRTVSHNHPPPSKSGHEPQQRARLCLPAG